MRLVKPVSILCLMIAGATAAYAQNADVIKQRREEMRIIAKAEVPPFRMTRDQVPFDLAAFQAYAKAIEEHAPKYKALFPANSKTGATAATEKVWESPAEFNTALDNLVVAARAASAAVKGEASLKVELPKVIEACGACHGRRGGFAPGLGESFKRMEEPL